MALFVGTSGWDYPEWKGEFYPASLRRADFLDYYSSQLGACEVNTTFYSLQTPETVERWLTSTPPSFRFAIKTHRRLTHTKNITARYFEFLHEFLETLEPFGDRLGSLLIQFPPTRERDDEALDRLLAGIPAQYSCAVEFRHESWDLPEVAERLGNKRATICLSDTTGEVPAALPPGPFGYVRLRAGHYTEEQREGWRSLLVREAERRDVYAFAKHKDVPANDPFTGAGFAHWLNSPVGTSPIGTSPGELRDP
jgi:uncharacterized protein YecE (DUF72 family)